MTTSTRIETIEHATNRTWDEWLGFMDSIDARNLDHHQIATQVLYELDGKIESAAWWAQSVTVAYEQHISRRLPGQRPDGTFQTSASKSSKLNMQDLMDRWVAFAAQDREVLDLIDGEVRMSGTENRINWRTQAKDGSSILLSSEPKANGTASIVVQQMGLQTNDLNLEAKAKWKTILSRFLASQ